MIYGKKLTLKKTETGRKAQKYLYEVFDGDIRLANRRSNREYQSALLLKNSDTLFFGNVNRMGTGESAKIIQGGKVFGTAILQEVLDVKES